jgi:hypothetical protein
MMPSRLCPLCEEPLSFISGVRLCGWCGFRLGQAEPQVTRPELEAAVARYLAGGGVITRLPDGPQPERAEIRLNEEIVLGLHPVPWDELLLAPENENYDVITRGRDFAPRDPATVISSGQPVGRRIAWASFANMVRPR